MTKIEGNKITEYLINIRKDRYKIQIPNNREFVSEIISELIYTNRIAKTSKIYFVVNPLSAQEQKDKKRFLLNLPHVNKHIFKKNI